MRKNYIVFMLALMLALSFSSLAAAKQGQGPGGGHGPGDGSGFRCPFDDLALTTFDAVVDLVSLPILEVIDSEGNQLTVYAGSFRYWAEQEFDISAGDELTISGAETACPNHEEESICFIAFTIENKTTGETIYLRDENGRPLWRGGGRGGDNRQQK